MRSNKKIPWIFIAVSLIFAFNPSISIIDPLPDFIGYILLSFALSRLAALNSTIAEAKRAFEWMILIDGGKILAVMWVFGMESLSERNTSVLVWCFAFAVLEGIFLIPAYLKLFSGISEIGDLYPSGTIHERASGRRRSATERMRNLSVGFLIFRALMNILPELSVLSETSNNEATYHTSLYRYIGVMRGFCTIPALIVGIVWAVRLIKYFKALSGDTELNPALAEAQRIKEETRRGLFIKSNVRTACWFLVAAAVFTLDIRLEKVNIVPDLITVALFIPALLYFARDTQIHKGKIHALIWVYGATSVIAQVLEAFYIDNFTYNAMNKNLTAFVFYFVSVIAVALQGGVFICLISAFFKEIRGVIVGHTGYVLGKEIKSAGEDERIAEVHREIGRSFSFAFDAAMLYVLSDVAYSLYGAFYAFANVNLGFLNAVNLAFGALFVGMTVKATGELRDAVNTKYMLE